MFPVWRTFDTIRIVGTSTLNLETFDVLLFRDSPYRRTVLSANFPFGGMSVGELSVGEVFVVEMSVYLT